MRIRVGTYNLQDGGLDRDGGDSRLRKQITMLNGLRLDLLGLQEAKWGEDGRDRLEDVAAELGMGWSTLVPSNFYGCDIAVLVRKSAHLHVVGERQLTGPPFVHCLADVRLGITGHGHRVHFLVGHCAPSSPATRLAEAEMVGVHRRQNVIYVADFNAVGLGDDPPTEGIDPVKVSRKLNNAPARELRLCGFHDVGLHMGDATPTVGHTGHDPLAYRCDRIYTTLPTSSFRRYGVLTTVDDLSDHRPVWAEFDIGE